MIGLDLHNSVLDLWGRIDARKYMNASEEVKQNIASIVTGSNGVKVQRDLCAIADKKKMNDYLLRYAKGVHRICTDIKEGHESALVNHTETEDGYVGPTSNSVFECAVGYVEEAFDDILNDESLNSLLQEFMWIRKHILMDTNNDIALIMVNAAREDTNINTERAKGILFQLCKEYELSEFMESFLSCNGAFECIEKLVAV